MDGQGIAALRRQAFMDTAGRHEATPQGLAALAHALGLDGPMPLPVWRRTAADWEGAGWGDLAANHRARQDALYKRGDWREASRLMSENPIAMALGVGNIGKVGGGLAALYSGDAEAAAP